MKLFSAAFLTANLFSHAVLILVALVYASPSHASTFGFSFINTANGSGTALVSGTISGLIDNASSQQATSVFVSFNGDGFGEESIKDPPR